MAGYAFARLPFRGRTFLFYLVVLGLLVPFFTFMIPLYFQLRSIGLLDTLPGAILVLASTGISFGTFFMRAFFAELPVELEQSARVDGASEWQIFTRVMLPLVGSGIGALTVFTFLANWNNFLIPLLYLPERRLPSADSRAVHVHRRALARRRAARRRNAHHDPAGHRALHRPAAPGHAGLHLRRRQGLTRLPSRATHPNHRQQKDR